MVELTIVMFISVFVLLGIMIYHSRQVDKRTLVYLKLKLIELRRKENDNFLEIEKQRRLHK